MQDNELLQWLALAHLPSLTSACLRRLQALSPDPAAILALPDHSWRCAGASAEALAARRRWLGRDRSLLRRVDKARATLEREQARLLIPGRPGYPALLAEIPDPPPLLYAAGIDRALATRQFAVVGSRRCSTAGARATEHFAGQLVRSGFSVCSGLAMGIDAAAHRGALEAGGPTVAVIATGIETCYPRRHRQLFDAIRARGAVVTEFNPGTPPRPERFPMRNRIISGLSVGVLVAEAALQSGSLITARAALEQNREVFAFPHSLNDPGGRGCHQLIRQGAVLVESIEDVVGDVGALCEAHREIAGPVRLAGEPVWEKLGYDPVSVDDLVAAGAGSAESVTRSLLQLELEGYVQRQGGLYTRRV